MFSNLYNKFREVKVWYQCLWHSGCLAQCSFLYESRLWENAGGSWGSRARIHLTQALSPGLQMGLPSAWRLDGCLLKTHPPIPWRFGYQALLFENQNSRFGKYPSNAQISEWLSHEYSYSESWASIIFLLDTEFCSKNNKGFLKAEPESGGCTLLKMRHSIDLWRFELLPWVLLSLLPTPLPCTAASLQSPERRLWNPCLIPDSGGKTLMF